MPTHLLLLSLVFGFHLCVGTKAGVNSTKLGLCCMGCNVTQYDTPLAQVANWVYRYSLYVDDDRAARWLAQRGIEFVPHLAHKNVPLPDGSLCTFDAADAAAAAPLCTAAQLDAALAKNTAAGLKVTHLMGWNEAYDRGNAKAKYKYIAPADAATYWRVHVQGMAARANLKLVSPTTGVEKGKLQWLGDMLLECRAQRAAAPTGCDAETITAFSVHDYKCGEHYWRENYGPGNGTFQRSLKAYLAARAPAGDRAYWASYVDARPIWVTETNCNADAASGLVSRSEQCARISGQRADQDCGEYGKCGMGSIATMESMASVARVSWWNTFQQNQKDRAKTANAMLVDAAGKLYPAGRALAGGLSKGTDCEEEGGRL